MFANDQSGVAPVGSGLDYTVNPNQHVELNLFGPGATVTNLYSGLGPAPGSWFLGASYDLSSYITANSGSIRSRSARSTTSSSTTWASTTSA